MISKDLKHSCFPAQTFSSCHISQSRTEFTRERIDNARKSIFIFLTGILGNAHIQFHEFSVNLCYFIHSLFLVGFST